MSVPLGKINRLVPGLIDKTGFNPLEKNTVKLEGNDNFLDVFKNLINSVDSLQKDASQLQGAFMSGEPVELHDVMIKAQEAGISMDLLLEIRNKLLNAYNKLMSMPI